MQYESYTKNRREGKFCRKCVWHFCVSGDLVGCDYHLCNDQGRGHPGGPGCPKFLKGDPKIRQNMLEPSEKNVRIKLGLDPPPPKPKPKPDPMNPSAPRPHKKGGKHPPKCYVPEPLVMSRKGTDVDMPLFVTLLRDRGGLYGLSKETGISTGTIARWKRTARISITAAERLRQIYGVDITRREG